MAYTLLGKVYKYIGTSADTKPTTAIPAGSTFYETNTGDLYQYDGSAWAIKASAVQVIDILGEVQASPTANTLLARLKALQDGITLTGSNVQDVTFQDAATAIGNGASLTVGGLKTLTVGIASAGGNTARTIEFHGVGPAGNDILITGAKLNDLSTGTSTTGTGEIWQFDIRGLASVYMKLTAITSGNVTVKGKAVA